MPIQSSVRKKRTSWKSRSPAILGLPFSGIDILKAVAETPNPELSQNGHMATLTDQLHIVAGNIMHVPPAGRTLLGECFRARTFKELSRKIDAFADKLQTRRGRPVDRLLDLHDRMLSYENTR